MKIHDPQLKQQAGSGKDASSIVYITSLCFKHLAIFFVSQNLLIAAAILNRMKQQLNDLKKSQKKVSNLESDLKQAKFNLATTTIEVGPGYYYGDPGCQ